MRKLSPREVIARSYPTWDLAMADRLLAWLDHNGYQIVEKAPTEVSLVPSTLEREDPLRLERPNPSAHDVGIAGATARRRSEDVRASQKSPAPGKTIRAGSCECRT
jgi:hypothetical protein